ncbi:hypothetical protein [Chitinophaga barathri]|uniref:Uncharacterized protein n=1 Tax=Chitinophaga barathri TaxID=1647451 RepID=A0A3N4MBW9_9BACT|nr:hypothetical protein [Chitinophaga barathri]RPD39316.1 hypothetical protein EG028_19510 [Chitinophaga barathri]
MNTAKNSAATAAKANGTANGATAKPTMRATKGGAMETTGKEKKEVAPANPLQNTLKVVHRLHQKVQQRTNLIAVIDQLESFKIKQSEDGTGESEYMGCEITIKDDNRHSWTTRNTFVIEAVTKYVESLCRGKLVEIEAEIKLPAA